MDALLKSHALMVQSSKVKGMNKNKLKIDYPIGGQLPFKHKAKNDQNTNPPPPPPSNFE